jgi:hypothetical protein
VLCSYKEKFRLGNTRRVIKPYEVTNKGEGELLPGCVKFLEGEGKFRVLLVP